VRQGLQIQWRRRFLLVYGRNDGKTSDRCYCDQMNALQLTRELFDAIYDCADRTAKPYDKEAYVSRRAQTIFPRLISTLVLAHPQIKDDVERLLTLEIEGIRKQ
jgi:hypothetical protein